MANLDVDMNSDLAVDILQITNLVGSKILGEAVRKDDSILLQIANSFIREGPDYMRNNLQNATQLSLYGESNSNEFYMNLGTKMIELYNADEDSIESKAENMYDFMTNNMGVGNAELENIRMFEQYVKD